jgi:hypothetical protein
MGIDRRKKKCSPSVAILGAIVFSFGYYGLLPYDSSMFYSLLSSLGIEREWSFLVMGVGSISMLSACNPNRILRWFANASTTLVCGWSFILFLHLGVYPHSATVCGIIAFGTLVDMIREAFIGVRMREGISNGVFS